jgi:hypothetical protein
MTGNLVSSGSDTDMRIGVVAALSLAVVISVVAVVGHRGAGGEGGALVLSASTPEMVRAAPKVVAQHPEGAVFVIE